MTTPTQDVVAIAREAGYSGIEARAERLLRDATEVRATGSAFDFLGLRTPPTNTPDLAAEPVARMVGRGWFLDSCQGRGRGGPPLQGYPIGRLVLVHLNDAPAKPAQEIEDADRLLPGEGVIKLAELTQDLRAGGYAGPWSLETFNPSYWAEDPRAVARRGFVAVSQNFSADKRSGRKQRKHAGD